MENNLLIECKALLDQGLNEKVIEVLSLFLNDYTEDCDGYYWRSIAKNRLQDRAGAMNDLYRVLDIDPSHKQALAALELHQRIMSFYAKDLLNP